jgi:nucleotide-binding universal stress UspA family protein
MIDLVVVPMDFTLESDRALTVAPALARWACAHVELVTIVAPGYDTAVEAELAREALLVGRGTTSRVVESALPPAEALVEELRNGKNELWCVGSHARGALGELIAGSLSEKLVRDAYAPVTLVGPHANQVPTGNVLAVTLDATNQSEAILPAAADLAADLGMTLRLLQVGRTGEPVPADVSETAYLAATAAQLTSIDPAAADYDVLHGDHPARSIAEYVSAHPEVGMIALATRGLRPRARLVHGSTAFELTHRAVVPVAILHQD